MSDTASVALGRRIIEILEKGKKTSTYKLATLLALMEYCIERAPDSDESVDVPLDILAERVIERYWQQTRPSGIDGDRALRQSGQATKILDDIRNFRETAHAGNSTTLELAKSQAPELYAETLKNVKRTLVRYPLRLLQTVPSGTDPFLYHDEWMQNATNAKIDRPDNVVRLREGVGYAMALLAGLLRPALEYLWVDKVWKSNHELFPDGLDVKRYLFEEDRVALAQVRPALKEAFGEECFYCRFSLKSGSHIDHVLPVSTYRINGLANLVLACGQCNLSKSDYPPAIMHVERALGISPAPGTRPRDEATLERIGRAIHWPVQYDRVKNTARSLFKLAAPQTKTWRGVGQPLDPLPSRLPAWVTDAPA